jgi:hypothetical protein
MKNIKKVYKTLKRRKNRNTRKTNKKKNRKIKKGGAYIDETTKKKEKNLRNKITNEIINLRKQIQESTTIDIDLIKKISRLISMVYVYKNLYADNKIQFPNNNELYRENYWRTGEGKIDGFLEKYNDKTKLNALLDELNSDFELVENYFRKTYLQPESQEETLDAADDNDDLERPLLSSRANKKPSNSAWNFLGF